MSNTRRLATAVNTLIVILMVTLHTGSAQDSENRIVFMSDHDGNREIYSMKPDGSDVIRLTNDPAEDIEPAWSPNYEQIAFVSNREGVSAVYVMQSDGTNVRRITGDNTGRYAGSPSWAPHQQQLAIVSNISGTNQIYIINVDGSRLRQLTDTTGESIHPSWSPDGTRIAFVSSDVGNYEVFVVDLNGSNLQQLTSNPDMDIDAVAWSPDSSQIAFSGFDSSLKSGELYVMNADGSDLRLVTSLPDTFVNSPTWSSDGSQIAYVVYSKNRLIQVIDINSGAIAQIVSSDGTNFDFPDWAAPAFLETFLTAEIELTCFTPAQRIDGDPGDTIVASCPADCSTGRIWGTDIYTDDSSVCIAALHAGVLDQQGGVISVTIQPGQNEYPSSRRGGIESGSWGPWGRSFSVADVGGNTPVLSAAASAVELTCNDTAESIAGNAGAALDVSCPADCPTRAIWGTDVYTDDSSVCTAARHAGVIDSSGGHFQLTILGSQRSYTASRQNGVQSGSWGRWNRSFSVSQTSSN